MTQNSEDEIKDLICDFAEKNNLSFEKLKNRTINISKSIAPIKRIDPTIVKSLLTIDYYCNWKFLSNRSEAFLYVYENISKENKNEVYKIYSYFGRMDECFKALLKKDSEQALDFFKNISKQKSDVFYKSYSRPPPEDFEDIILEVAKKDKENFSNLLYDFLINNQSLLEGGLYCTTYKFALKKIIENNLDKQEFSRFSVFNLNLHEDKLENSNYIENIEEEIYIIRINTEKLNKNISIDVNPRELKDAYDRIIDNITRFLNDEGKKFLINFCERTHESSNSKIIRLLISKKPNSHLNKDGLEKFIFNAIEQQSKNVDVIFKEEVKDLLSSLYLIGNLKDKLDDDMPIKTNNKKQKI